ncbi:MAG: SDR family oxidoreductase [Acidimicrobiia bacterium]|nr:SDR family oxidoreductase [Acidimicrobiia bacterium]
MAGEVAVVTGGSQGIGLTVATAMAGGGARVAVLDLHEPAAGAPDAMFVRCDVADEPSVDAAFSAVEEALGPVSILVNNAGVFPIASIEDTTRSEWDRTLAINLTGAFLCSQRVLPGMRAAGYGRIVSIGSSAGKTGGAKHVAAYAASKAGVMALAKSIASEYAAHGITSNALAPALINTDMVAGIADLADQIPVGRLGEPEDVARAVLFLAARESSFITAEVMDVNGGFLID